MSKESNMNQWALGMIGKYTLIFLGFVLYTILIARGAEAKASRKYEQWQERWANEYITQQEAAQLGMPADPYQAQLDAEAEEMAKVLYGVRDNSVQDMRTYCWCVFNRVDSNDYPDTLEEVINQPSQWMRYSPDNQVLENLFQIAREELDAWHTGSRRPVGNEYVFMNWTPARIVLRDRWETDGFTNYWRYGA